MLIEMFLYYWLLSFLKTLYSKTNSKPRNGRKGVIFEGNLEPERILGLQVDGPITRKEPHRIPFVKAVNPALPNIRQVISRNLRSSQQCLKTFTSRPRISYRRCKTT